MTIKVSNNKKKEFSIKQVCVKCFKGTNLIKTVVTIVCFVLLVRQISSCILKLIYIPITTYTHFEFNKTIKYPSVTFCREPAYKFEKLLEYGLYIHPRYTSAWMNFNFSSITLDQLWDEVTYNETDFFIQYGLEHESYNVILTPVMGFLTGRCYTVSPNLYNTTASSQARGYSFTLQHTMADIAAAFGTIPPGYHVHIHYINEPYTEVDVYNGGLVDYIYINTGETLDVKLTVNEYVKISEDDDPCVDQDDYSANDCTTRYVWDSVGKAVGCSGPWMKSNLPYCDNYEDMRNLISTYMNTRQHHNYDSCHRICRSLLYNGFVQDRQKFYHWNSNGVTWNTIHKINTAADLQTTPRVALALALPLCLLKAVRDKLSVTIALEFWRHREKDDRSFFLIIEFHIDVEIYIHFNNMMVSVYEERYNYDWNLFLSDLGGSIGFLLGLSVIGLISILSHWLAVLGPLVCKSEMEENGVIDSAEGTTTDEDFKKYKRNNNIYVVN